MRRFRCPPFRSSTGKTQRSLKTKINEHIGDIWKVIESGEDKFDDN